MSWPETQPSNLDYQQNRGGNPLTSFPTSNQISDTSSQLNSFDYIRLIIRQQPQISKCAITRDKGGLLDRKSINPPPIVQITIEDNDINQMWLNERSFFVMSCLYDAHTDQLAVSSQKKARDNTVGESLTVGSMTSSLQKVQENNRVYSAKQYPGSLPSTQLSQLISDQGIRLRLRKELKRVKSKKVTPPNVPTSNMIYATSGSSLAPTGMRFQTQDQEVEKQQQQILVKPHTSLHDLALTQQSEFQQHQPTSAVISYPEQTSDYLPERDHSYFGNPRYQHQQPPPPPIRMESYQQTVEQVQQQYKFPPSQSQAPLPLISLYPRHAQVVRQVLPSLPGVYELEQRSFFEDLRQPNLESEQALSIESLSQDLSKEKIPHQGHSRSRSSHLGARLHPYEIGITSSSSPTAFHPRSQIGLPSSSESEELHNITSLSIPLQSDILPHPQSELQNPFNVASNKQQHEARSLHTSLDYRYQMPPITGDQYRERSPFLRQGLQQRPRPHSTVLSFHGSSSPLRQHSRNQSSSRAVGVSTGLQPLPPSRILESMASFPESGAIRLPPIQFPSSQGQSSNLLVQKPYYGQSSETQPLRTELPEEQSFSQRPTSVASPRPTQFSIMHRSDPRNRYSLPPFRFPPQTSSQFQRNTPDSDEKPKN